MSSVEHVTKVEELIRQVAVIITHRGRRQLENYSVTPPQFSALLVLIKNGEITMGELCQKLFLACSTVTDLIDRMEKNGFVERFKDEKDRRVSRLRVLPAGFSVYEEVLKARQAYVSSMLEKLSPEEHQQIVTALEKLHSVMS